MKPNTPVPSTLWTQIIEVIQTGNYEDAERALGEFCERYRPVIVEFFFQRGCAPDLAEDYAHEFITSRILSRLPDRKSFLHEAERSRTKRFRYFLFTVLKRFYCDKIKERLAQKAGGGAIHVSIEGHDLPSEGAEAQRIERQFDRKFAGETFRNAVTRSVRSQYFLAYLLGEMDQAEAAARLGMTANSFKQRLFHFKRGFRQSLRDEVSKLVGPDPREVDEEIRYLLSLFVESGA